MNHEFVGFERLGILGLVISLHFFFFSSLFCLFFRLTVEQGLALTIKERTARKLDFLACVSISLWLSPIDFSLTMRQILGWGLDGDGMKDVGGIGLVAVTGVVENYG